MRTNQHNFSRRILGAVDLAIDLATLGEYGLETLPGDTEDSADGLCRERRGHTPAWEALATTRRGACCRPATRAGRIRAGYAA